MKVQYKIPLMLIITILMIIAIKFIFPAPVKNTAIEDEFWLRKTHASDHFDVVIGGDSRIYRGFSIAAMNASLETDISGINMGYSSTGYSMEYMDLLEKRLNKEGARILVLGLTPHSFTIDATKNELYHEHKNKGRVEVLKGKYLSRYLKHFSAYKVSELVDFTMGIKPERYYHQTFMESGWVKSYTIPEDSMVAVDIYRRIFTDYQVEDTIVSNFLDRIVKIRERGIQVIAYRPPTFDVMSNLEDSLSGFDEEYIRAQMESSGCVWMEFENSDFHTYDGSHLHYQSAEKLSRLVGDRIREMIMD